MKWICRSCGAEFDEEDPPDYKYTRDGDELNVYLDLYVCSCCGSERIYEMDED